ncbi:MAG TPA: cupin domain-containing protein [Actinomycetota bacterium]|nr:cupin domain-containing protein [Actinomycetota bacterium]
MSQGPSRHLVRRAAEAAPAVPSGWEGRSRGYRRWTAVDEGSGALHTGFAVCVLERDGQVDAHVHSFEETIYVLEGEGVLLTPEGGRLLRAGDYGLVPVGVPHAWRGAGGTVRWAEMQAPGPRDRYGGDTLFVPPLPEAGALPVDVRDPRNRRFGHIEPWHLEVDKQTQELMAVSASMRTALLVYSGITVKMMVDQDLGAQLSTMFMVQYEPGGRAGAHDHPFEETYLILEGQVEATFDGASYLLEAGDLAWAGVGCVHGFHNPGPGRVRWLETQAPQPPARHSYRFVRDWDYLREVLGAEGGG